MTTEGLGPDKAFYETNPRAALLRNACLEVIEASRVVLGGDGETALPYVMDANRRLEELGIEPSMHVVRPDDPQRDEKKMAIYTDPVLAAEWIAGQLRRLLIRTAGLTITAAGLREQLEEHDELLGEGNGLHLIRAGVMTDRMVDIGMLGILSGMIDYDAGPSE